MHSASRPRDRLPKRVVVVRALAGLGDFLCAVPALRALRAGLPDAHIALVGLGRTRHLVERFGQYLDDVLVFPGYPGIVEEPVNPSLLPAFLERAQSLCFDLALQMHGSGVTSNSFTVLLGARLNAGLYVPGQYCPDPERFLPYPDHEHEVRRCLRLVEFLGFARQGEHLEFPLNAADYRSLSAIGEARHLEPNRYICIHAGASLPERRWPAHCFAAVADALAHRGWPIVFTGSQAEIGLAAQVAACMTAPALVLAGRTELGALAALLSRARMLLSNDTGVAHLAAATRTASVIVFSSSDLVRWGPLDARLHRAVGEGTRDAVWVPLGRADAARLSNHAKSMPDAPRVPEVGEVLAEAEELLSSS